MDQRGTDPPWKGEDLRSIARAKDEQGQEARGWGKALAGEAMTGQSTGQLRQSGAGRGDGWQHEAQKRNGEAGTGAGTRGRGMDRNRDVLQRHGTGAIGAALQWMGRDGEDRGAGD